MTMSISTEKRPRDFHDFSHRVLHHATRGVPGIDFLREITKMLLDFSGCDAVEVSVRREDKCYHCEAICDCTDPVVVEITRRDHKTQDPLLDHFKDSSRLQNLRRAVVEGQVDPSAPFFTKHGSFWVGNMQSTVAGTMGVDAAHKVSETNLDYASLAIIPLVSADETIGLVHLKSKKEDYLKADEIELYETVAHTLGLALVSQLAHFALRERVKELTCLYKLAQLADRPNITLDEILQGIVELLPLAWQYPEIAGTRIILDGRSYATGNFKEDVQKQSAAIVVSGERRGCIEVVYLEEKPELDEGPFLKEERSLIDAVARQISLIMQRRKADEERLRLQDQLRHADRLATIGQLAAGVAHELNEPLGNILGFAQLAKKCQGLPQPAKGDIQKIETASLHAREVIRKLMLFARQMPPQKTKVNLNNVVKEGLYFLESRCAKDGIELVRVLSPSLPEITADPAQLNQVLVNLVVNAAQAMPTGGRLTVRTSGSGDHVSLVVEDTGIGMSKETIEQIFIPFFTTKDVGQGTGLGLPVVHGIVTSHGGSIQVESEVGRGSRFEVRLPLAGAQK